MSIDVVIYEAMKLAQKHALRDAIEAVKAAAERGPLFSVRNSGDPQLGWDAASRHAVHAIEELMEQA